MIDIMKHKNAVTFYTPIGCMAKLMEHIGQLKVHSVLLLPSLRSTFEVSILFIPFLCKYKN
jgi:hypothetical protein